MGNFLPYVWLATIIFTSICEIATAQLVSIWFVLGSVAALITSLFTDDILTQVLVFLAVTFVTLIATRPLVKKLKNVKVVETNSGRCIGKVANVTVEINNTAGQGQVNVEGAIWSARSNDDSVITEGAQVKILSIEGVKLIVEKI